MSVLKRETGFFVRKTKLLRFRPYGSNFRGGTSWPHKFDGGVKVFATPLVSIHHRVRCVADCEASVVASTIAHVAVHQIEISGIARTQESIREHVRVQDCSAHPKLR